MRVISVTIPGSPGPAAVNRSHSVDKRGRVYKTAKARAWSGVAYLHLHMAWVKAGRPSFKLASVRIVSHWPRQRHLDGTTDLPIGDVDAPVKAVLDAIESAGIVDDDVRIVHVEASKELDAKRPRIEIEITERTQTWGATGDAVVTCYAPVPSELLGCDW